MLFCFAEAENVEDLLVFGRPGRTLDLDLRDDGARARGGNPLEAGTGASFDVVGRHASRSPWQHDDVHRGLVGPSACRRKHLGSACWDGRVAPMEPGLITPPMVSPGPKTDSGVTSSKGHDVLELALSTPGPGEAPAPIRPPRSGVDPSCSGPLPPVQRPAARGSANRGDTGRAANPDHLVGFVRGGQRRAFPEEAALLDGSGGVRIIRSCTRLFENLGPRTS